MQVGVVGAGAFGTAIASMLAQSKNRVTLWAYEAEVARSVREQRENTAYLPGVPLCEELAATCDLAESVRGAQMVVLATPSHVLRGVVEQLRPLLPVNIPIVTVAKGIENETLYTMTEVLEETLPVERHPYLAVLSGPSFAREVALGVPTAVTAAARWERLAREVQRTFSSERFRVYSSTDVIGVQYGGSLKNVMAIAVGCSEGLGFGLNARAALITRGLAEMSRAAVRRGANPATLSGLSGLGDLVLTCTGELSRNRQLGHALGKGGDLKALLEDRRSVAEGVKTAKSACQLAERLGIEMPVVQETYRILYEGKSVHAAVGDLMGRELKSEI